jgi:hypothetical protein
MRTLKISSVEMDKIAFYRNGVRVNTSKEEDILAKYPSLVAVYEFYTRKEGSYRIRESMYADVVDDEHCIFKDRILSFTNESKVINSVKKTADDIATQGRLDARVEFGNTLKALGLPQNLVDELDNMIKQDYTKSQMYLELQKTPAWKERFPGMEGLAKAGKAVDAGTYISMEKGFLQTLDYYGLDKKLFGTTAELGKQSANLVSPKRFETVVALAAQDVENNPDVLAGLNLYYGVDKSAAISYLLNPEIGLDIIQRQARAAEIGAKAGKSKFEFGMTKEGAGVAESFINAAGTMDLQALDISFQQARQLANTQTSIAATEGASYNDLSAVSAILGKDQAALLDSQRRAARATARFTGSSGLGSGSLKRESAI